MVLPEKKAKISVKHQRRPRSSPGVRCRAAAALMVEGVLKGQSLTLLQTEHTQELSASDKALACEIAYGTLRHLSLLQAAFARLSEHAARTDMRVAALICCALYQLTMLTRLPAHAAVSTTVSACGLVGRKYAAGLVNAVLRRFLREGAALPQEVPEWVHFSIAPWMYQRWCADYGAQQAAQIAAQSNVRAPMFLRVETDKITPEAYLKLLHKSGIEAQAAQPYGLIKLAKAQPMQELPLFKAGQVSVQDLAAQCAVPLLMLQDGQQVLDCCCAPGGKSAQILASGKQISLTACDSDPQRLLNTVRNLVRLQRLPQTLLPQGDTPPASYHAPGITLRVQDAATLKAGHEMFDRILLDAPCSGSGVIRRHPDIKWLRRDEDIAALTKLQRRILEAAWSCLKEGGILVYTTCSIFKAENSAQIDAFIADHPDAQPLPFDLLGHHSAQVQRLPGMEDGDGFFYARLRKEQHS